MKNKNILLMLVIFLLPAIVVKAQSWNLTGNANAANNSKLGTTNAIPLRLFTNNSLRMYISTAGNVGIGTNAPSYKLHVVGAANGIYGSGTTYGVVGSGGTYGVYGSGSSYGVYGYSAGNYGVYGNSGYLGVYGTGASYGVYGYSGSSYGVYGSSSGGIGVTGSSSTNYGVYGYSTSSYGVNGSSGYLGVYGDGDSYGLYGYSGGNYGMFAYGGYIGAYGSGGTYGVYGYSSSGVGTYCYSGSSNALWSYAANSATSGIYAGVFESKVWSYGGYYESSDKNVKKNIKDISNAMGIINQLKPKNYEFRDDGELAKLNLPKGTHYGLIAQDLELVLPELVNDGPKKHALSSEPIRQKPGSEKNPVMAEDLLAKPGLAKDESLAIKGIKYSELIPIMIKGMQEQDALIQKQQAQIDELKSLLAGVKGNTTSDVVGLTGAWLKQNSPNPFGESTTIQFSLPVSAKEGQLLVYDQGGRLVKAIALGSGQNQVSIAKGSLPGGNYVYALMVDGKKVDSKSMIIAK